MTLTASPALPLPFEALPELPTDPIWRLTVEQYHTMISAGILRDGDAVELLEGWLITKLSKNPPHRITTKRTLRALERAVPTGWYVDSQEPITTPDSEPEPDLSVVRGDTADYADRHPGPADVGLVVEVSDVTLQRDRTTKKRAYARAGIVVYWIVNLVDRTVEVYTDPTGPAAQPDYQVRTDHPETGSVTLRLDGREVAAIPVRDLLP